jgi:hypothetical protein
MRVVQDRLPPVESQPTPCSAARLVVNVVSTSERETSAAIQAASVLARNLDAVVRIVSFQIVPYPLDLDQPCVPPAFFAARWASLVRGLDTEVQCQICYCREIAAAVAEALSPNSLVVVGRRTGWWPRRGNRLVRLLLSHHHKTVVVDVR